MKYKTELSPGFENTLKQWAKETLEAIGIFEERTPDFEQLKIRTIDSLRAKYSDKMIDLFLTPVDRRRMESPDASAVIKESGSDTDDTMEFFLKTADGIIVDSCFQTSGCRPAVASGGLVSEMIKGKNIDEILKITPQDVIDALGCLPDEDEYWALLAVNTMKKALDNLRKR